MPKYIQTQIRRLDNGDVEVVSTLNISFALTVCRKDGAEGIEVAKARTRLEIILKLFGQIREIALGGYDRIMRHLSGLDHFQHYKAREDMEIVFTPLLNAGKWLEEDAEDSE